MSAHKVVGAAWCGYSKKQFEELGCSDNADGTTSCKAKTADGNPIQFTWCMDAKNQKINSDKPECQQQTQGYPAWIDPNGTPSKDLQGFMPACAVKDGVLDKTQLNCAKKEEAMQTCKTLMEAAEKKPDVAAKIEELKTASKAAQEEVQKFSESKQEGLKSIQQNIESLIKSERDQCKAALDSAKPLWD